MRTSSAPQICFVGERGEVVFENVGELANYYRRITDWFFRKDAHPVRELRPGREASMSALAFLRWKACQITEMKQFESSAFDQFIDHPKVVNQTLVSLNGLEVLTPEVAVRAAGEACLQMFGEVDLEAKLHLRTSFFSDESGGCKIGGYELVSAIEKGMTARGLSTWEREVFAKVIESPGEWPKELSSRDSEEKKLKKSTLRRLSRGRYQILSTREDPLAEVRSRVLMPVAKDRPIFQSRSVERLINYQYPLRKKYQPVSREVWKRSEEDVLAFTEQIVSELHQEGYLLAAQNDPSSPEAQVQVVNEEGQVIFNSVTELCNLCIAARKYAQSSGQTRMGIPEEESRRTGTPHPDLVTCIPDRALQDDPLERAPMFARQDPDPFPSVMLRSLNGVTEATLPDHALSAMKEACIQLYGRIPQNLDEIIGSHDFYDQSGTFFVKGKDLFEFGEKVLVARGDGSHRLKNVGSGGVRPRYDFAKAVDASTGIQEEAQEEAKQAFLNRLLQQGEVRSEVVFYALVALGVEDNTPKGYRRFLDRVVESRALPAKDEERAPKETFKKFVSTFAPSQNEINFDVLSRQRLTDLLKSLYYAEGAGDPELILDDLSKLSEELRSDTASKSDELVAEALGESLGELQSLFELQRSYREPESIQQKLLPAQIEGVVAALHLERRIFLFGMSAGKTLTAAAAAEAITSGELGAVSREAQFVLYATKSSNVTDTAMKLREEILASDKKVIELDSRMVNLSAAQFEQELKEADYLVAGYDTLRSLHQRSENEELSPEKREEVRGKFEALQRRVLQGVRILDEFHLLDNPQSGRTEALRHLAARYSFGGSGTPYQHRPERVATILHLTYPDRFPNVDELTVTFKQEPALAKQMLHASATVYGVEDLGKEFEDPEVCGKSFTVQLKEHPRLARLRYESVPYQLTFEQSLMYIDLALRFDQVAPELGMKPGPLQQISALKRLISHPARLGLSGDLPFEGVVSQRIGKRLERGEKALVLGYSKNPLRVLSENQSLSQYESIYLHGGIKPSERARQIRAFEETKGLQCVYGQVNAIGTGYQARSADELFVLGLPPLTSTLVQSLARTRRLLFAGQERFARQEIPVTFFVPTLDPQAIAEVREPRLREMLSKGTIYEQWHDEAMKALELYSFYTSRGATSMPSKSSLQGTKVISALRREAKKFASLAEENGSLVRQRMSLFGTYNSPAKRTWHSEELGAHLDEHLDALDKPRTGLKVCYLPGPQALELDVYRARGIPAENTFGYERDRKARGKLVQMNVTKHGGIFCPGSFEEGVLSQPDPIDILSADPDGYFSGDLFHMFVHVQLAQSALVIKNTLAGREDTVASQLIEIAGGDRESLDAWALKLCGTKLGGFSQSQFPVRLMQDAVTLRNASRVIASRISQCTSFDQSELFEMIFEVTLQSPHIVGYRRSEYHTGPQKKLGSTSVRYRSVLTRLQQWDPYFGSGLLATKLRAATKELGKHARNDGVKAEIGAVKVKGTPDGIQLEVRKGRPAIISNQSLGELLEYFRAWVPRRYRLEALPEIEMSRIHVPQVG